MPLAEVDWSTTLLTPHPPQLTSFAEVLASVDPWVGDFEPTLADDVLGNPCTVRRVEPPDGEPDSLRQPTSAIGEGGAIVDDLRDGWKLVDHHFVYDGDGRVVLAARSTERFRYDRAAALKPIEVSAADLPQLVEARRIVRGPNGVVLAEKSRDYEGLQEIHRCRDRRGLPTGDNRMSGDRSDLDPLRVKFDYDDGGRPVRGFRKSGESYELLWELTWSERNELTQEQVLLGDGVTYAYVWSDGRPVKSSTNGVDVIVWRYPADGRSEVKYTRLDGTTAGVRRFVGKRETEAIAYDERTRERRDRLRVKLDDRDRPIETKTQDVTILHRYDTQGRETMRSYSDAAGKPLHTLLFGYEGCRAEQQVADFLESGPD